MNAPERPAEPQLPGVEFWMHDDGRQVYMRLPGQKRGALFESFTKAGQHAIAEGLAPYRNVFLDPKSLAKEDYPITRTRKTEES